MRRNSPEADTRSVEEVMLHRRLVQLGGTKSSQAFTGLPKENYVRKVSNAASVAEGMRKKHKLQSLKHRTPTGLEPLSILNGLSSPSPVKSDETLFTRSVSLGMLGGSVASAFNARYNASHGISSPSPSQDNSTPQPEPLLVAKLTAKCNALAERLKVLELELLEARKDQTRDEMDTSMKKASNERIDGTMVGMREKISQLKDVFYTSVNEEATRESCVIRIQMHIRRCVVRRRFLNMRNAVLSWRLSHSQELVTVCHREIDRQRKISLKATSFKVMREMKLLQNVVNVWEKEMRQGQALRRHIREAVSSMEGIMQHRWLKQVLRSWRGVCSGPSSKKACKSRYMRRVEEARLRIEERIIKEKKDKGESDVASGIITKEMITEEMNRGLHKEMVQRRRFHCLSQHLAALRRAVHMSEDAMYEAERHHAQKVLSSVFYPWTEWAFTHARGLDRKQWRGPRRYEVPYNKRRVEIWSRIRILRRIIPAWREAASRYAHVRRLERNSINTFVKIHFDAWVKEASRFRSIRRHTMDNWMFRCRSLIERPFRAWFVYTDNRLRERADSIRLVAQYRRLKTRQFMWKIMRTWRHQAVFGKVEGLYSRTELMRSLAEQKIHSKALEHHAKEFTAAIGESTQVLEEEHATVKALESQLEGREMEVANLQMALQHCEQDVVRMRGIVDAIAQQYPSLTNHLVEMQDAFGFQRRGLDDLARLRREEEANAFAAADLEEAEDWLAEFTDELQAARLKRASLGASSLTPEEVRLISTGDMHEEFIRSRAEVAGEVAAVEATKSLPTMASAATTALSEAAAPTIAGGAREPISVEEPNALGMKPLKLERKDSMRNNPVSARSDLLSARSGVTAHSRASRSLSRTSRTRRVSQDRRRLSNTMKDVPPPLSEKESSALMRMQFCFNYINFREVTQFGGERLYADYDQSHHDRGEEDEDEGIYDGAGFDSMSATNNPDLTADIIDRHVANNESMRKDLVMLHGALEFMRTGNVEALSNRLKKEWRRLETDNAGGYAGRYWDNLGGAQSMVKDGARTWNDFLVACTAKLPSHRRTTKVEEKLVRRIAAAHERSELTASGLYGAKDKTSLALNPYSSKPVDDDFRPGTPEEWAHEPRPDDKATADAVNTKQRESVASALECPIGIPFGRAPGLPIGSEKASTLTAFSNTGKKRHEGHGDRPDSIKLAL